MKKLATVKEIAFSILAPVRKHAALVVGAGTLALANVAAHAQATGLAANVESAIEEKTTLITSIGPMVLGFVALIGVLLLAVRFCRSN